MKITFKKLLPAIILTSACNISLFAQETASPALSLSNGSAFNIFSDEESINMSLEEAIDSAMTRNQALTVERLKPILSQSSIEKEKARFDAGISAEISGTERLGKTIFQQGNLGDTVSNRTDAAFTISELSRSGTKTEAGLTFARNRSANSDNLFSTRLGVSIQHPLMNGSGAEVNLVSLKKSELDRDISEFELNAFIMNLVAQVEKRYWQSYLATRELEIVSESLALAQQQREETYRRIEAGSIPESEAAAAEAEVAMREEDVIYARSQAVKANISLLRSINPDSAEFWRSRARLSDSPVLSKANLPDLEKNILLALENRPELMQARLLLEKDKLDVVYSENGILPKLDFFITLGKTGYSKSLTGSNPRPGQEGSYDISAGFIYDLASGRRAARAELTRSKVSAVMREESIKNLEQIIKEDVINAYIEVQRTTQQLSATAATSQKQQEKLRVEEVRFNVGKTTSFQVAQAQRDLTAARIAEVKAIVDYTNSITELLRADGTLLQRHGIATLTGK